jgi:hypothetical protein
MSFRFLVLSLLLANQLTEGQTPVQLTGRIWRIADGRSQTAAGTIYIFVADGSLLETSCVETYRIARWSADKGAPNVLRVTEDGELAFTAKILELTPSKLRIQRKLTRGNKEIREITLKAVSGEFVCPDLPK